METRKQLKDVFSGVASVMFQKEPIFGQTGNEVGADQLGALTLTPDYDLPVHVDDLSLDEGDPTLNHYKVFGDDADWVATSTKGEFNLSMLVPTLATNVLKLAYGDEAVVDAGGTLAADSGVGAEQTSWSGIGIHLDSNEVHGTVILLNEAKDRMLIISNAALWATLKFSNGSTDPVAVQFTGTIESCDGPDILYLKKTTPAPENSETGGGD